MKNKNILYWLSFVIVLIATLIAIRFITPEDNWICVNDKWEKHGNPTSPMPKTGCGPKVEILENQYIENTKYKILLLHTWTKASQIPKGIELLIVNNAEILPGTDFKSYYALTNSTSTNSLDDFLPLFEKELKKVVPEYTVDNLEDGTINNQPAKRFQLHFIQNNIRFIAYVALIQGKANDVWTITLNTTETMKDYYKLVSENILKNFVLK